MKGKRKFVVAMTALGMIFILALKDKLDPQAIMLSVTGIVGLYAGAEAHEGRGHALAQREDAG